MSFPKATTAERDMGFGPPLAATLGRFKTPTGRAKRLPPDTTPTAQLSLKDSATGVNRLQNADLPDFRSPTVPTCGETRTRRSHIPNRSMEPPHWHCRRHASARPATTWRDLSLLPRDPVQRRPNSPRLGRKQRRLAGRGPRRIRLRYAMEATVGDGVLLSELVPSPGRRDPRFRVFCSFSKCSAHLDGVRERDGGDGCRCCREILRCIVDRIE